MKFTASSLAIIATVFVSSTHAATLDQCSISLLGLISDPGLNACLPMQQLSSLATAPVITPKLVNDTATAFCSFPVCPPASVTLVQNTVSQNCVNASDPATAELVLGAASLYPPFREGMCQRIPGGNGTFCVTELAETMTAYLAKHPSPLGIKIFANSTVLKQYVDEMPKEILCTPCNKAIINPIENYISANKATIKPQILQWATILQTEAEKKCGAGFTDGQKPTATAAPGTKPTGSAGAGGNSGVGKVVGGGGSMAALVVAVVGALLL
ncbi:hypothetical protein BG015_004982 [Linnemannia schmuckeri]|uniref:Uncharacterized protein n=1 Tax=Linnemannia schmuckeri TaxID=64567 RepID=A0A9P5UY88_9FUNG|nr:hypothetical protein BG015_004982 [Linnemannia schmuckeri]